MEQARMGDALNELAARVAAWCRETRLPAEGATVVVACSGGADSLALLLALAPLPFSLRAVYVDHGLRPGTEREAALVAEVAASLGVESEVAYAQVSRHGNLMAAARAARYAALIERANRAGATFVAVGHTASDQAETVAFRRERDDLPHALAGMPVTRWLTPGLLLVRPLMAAGVTREQTQSMVRSAGLRAVEDPSNQQLRFARVRLRQSLAQDSPAATRELLDLAALSAARLAADDAAAAAMGDPADLDCAQVALATPEVVLRLLRRAGLHRARLENARAVIALAASPNGSRAIDLGGGLRADRSYGRLRIAADPPEQIPDVEVAVTGPGRYPFQGRVVELVALAPGAPPRADTLATARLPAHLVLRNLRAGDRLRTAAGGRKLHDVLIDRKVPRHQRRRLALLAPADGGELAWVEGVGAASPMRPRLDEAERWWVRLVAPLDSTARDSAGGG